MRKKMRKYNPGGPTGPGNVITPDKTQPVNPPMNPPVNSTVPQTTTQPAAPITNSATAQVPQTGTGNALLDAQNRYIQAGYRKGQAKRMARKEVNPTLAGEQAAYAFKQQKRANRPKFGQILSDAASAANTGLDLVNKATPIVSAIRRENGGATKSRFESGGGVMSGKELRRNKSFESGGETGGRDMYNTGKSTRAFNKAGKAYGKAAKSFSKGKTKKAARQMNRADRKMSRANKISSGRR